MVTVSGGKSVRSQFSTVFHVIFKKSLNGELLPKQWKQANVKALFKKGNEPNVLIMDLDTYHYNGMFGSSWELALVDNKSMFLIS